MKTIILIISLFSFLNCSSQQNRNPFYTEFTTSFKESKELNFLKKVDSVILTLLKNVEEGQIKDLPYDIYFAGSYNYDWRMSMTSHEIKNLGIKTVEDKGSNNFSTYINWNTQIDTGLVVGFSRRYDLDTYRKIHNKVEYFGKKNVPLVTIGLGNYKNIISSNEYDTLNKIIIENIVRKFNLYKSGSLFTRITSTRFDSINALPQVPINQIQAFLTALPLTLDYNCAVYADLMLSHELTKSEYTTAGNGFDTVFSEGSMAVLRYESAPSRLVVIEKWYFNEMESNIGITYFIPPSYFIYKKITAIGMTFENNKTVYYNYEEIKEKCLRSKINCKAFEEIIRAETLRNLNLMYDE